MSERKKKCRTVASTSGILYYQVLLELHADLFMEFRHIYLADFFSLSMAT